jgi:hypothetical protein
VQLPDCVGSLEITAAQGRVVESVESAENQCAVKPSETVRAAKCEGDQSGRSKRGRQRPRRTPDQPHAVTAQTKTRRPIIYL